MYDVQQVHVLQRASHRRLPHASSSERRHSLMARAAWAWRWRSRWCCCCARRRRKCQSGPGPAAWQPGPWRRLRAPGGGEAAVQRWQRPAALHQSHLCGWRRRRCHHHWHHCRCHPPPPVVRTWRSGERGPLLLALRTSPLLAALARVRVVAGDQQCRGQGQEQTWGR